MTTDASLETERKEQARETKMGDEEEKGDIITSKSGDDEHKLLRYEKLICARKIRKDMLGPGKLVYSYHCCH